MAQEVAIFDIDKTLLKGQSQMHLLNFLRKQKRVGIYYALKIYLWFLLYKINFIHSPKKIMEYAFRFLKGKSNEEISLIICDFFEKDLKNKIYSECMELIRKHKQENRKIILVSNTIEPIAECVSRYAGADIFLATQLEQAGDIFTGEISGEPLYGEEKRRQILAAATHHGFSLKNSWAYGDHITDIPVLELATHSFVVNPDKSLLKIAVKRKWGVIFFKK
ncbi:MAG: HAD-IB family hydrolase [Patescibacteria group bacterium]